MRIRCDNCGQEFEKEEAVVHEVDEGEIYYFCTEACFETSEHVDVGEPAEEERAEPNAT